MSGKKIYIVAEAIRKKQYGQNYPEVVDIVLHGAFTTKKAAETEKSKHVIWNTIIKETFMEASGK